MDIDLLSKMVSELILDSDEVSLPGVGTFVADMIPASFSDKGYTINPPYRRLSFRQKQGNDNRLIEFYAAANSLEYEDAARILTRYLQEMKDVLKTRKTIIFPGLGRLRATKENNFFFVPDPDLNIYPEGFGLESISLKTHVEDRAEVAAAVASLEPLLQVPVTNVPEPAPAASGDEVPAEPVESVSGDAVPAEPAPAASGDEVPAESVEPAPAASGDEVPSEPVEPAPDVAELAAVESIVPAKVPFGSAASPESFAPAEGTTDSIASPEPVASADVPAPAVESRIPKWVWIIPCVIVCFALLIGVYLLLARVAPDFIDRILYSPEELQILNYPLE